MDKSFFLNCSGKTLSVGTSYSSLYCFTKLLYFWPTYQVGYWIFCGENVKERQPPLPLILTQEARVFKNESPTRIICDDIIMNRSRY